MLLALIVCCDSRNWVRCRNSRARMACKCAQSHAHSLEQVFVTDVCMHFRKSVWSSALTEVCVYIYTYIHTCTHTYIFNVYIHIYYIYIYAHVYSRV